MVVATQAVAATEAAEATEPMGATEASVRGVTACMACNVGERVMAHLFSSLRQGSGLPLLNYRIKRKPVAEGFSS